MAAALRSSTPPPPPRRTPTVRQPGRGRSRGRSGQPAALHPQANSAVYSLPRPRPLPFWLQMLLRVQRYSGVVTLLLILAVLTVYGWTVYSQQFWGREYSKLESLRRDERQLRATGAMLKNQIAEQAAQPGVNLVRQTPSNTIFLKPAPQRPAAVPPASPAPTAQKPHVPLGY